MIAYGICIGSDHKFETFARPGLRRCAAPDAPIAESRENTTIFAAYNEILDHFGSDPNLEGLVLMHEDVELRDEQFEDKLRAAFADPQVGIVGAIGAVGVSSLSWWEGEGRGRCLETRGLIDFGGGTHTVDCVDGLLLALSPWVVRNLRFDELTYHGFHGYDVDICLQTIRAGKHVIVTDIDLNHHTKGGFGDMTAFQRADAAFKAKWIEPKTLEQVR